jgi:hypothetical protein
MQNRSDGYFYFTDNVTGSILSLWDYDGTRIWSNELPPWRDVHNFILLYPGHIRDIWKSQSESGKWQDHPSWTAMQEGVS